MLPSGVFHLAARGCAWGGAFAHFSWCRGKAPSQKCSMYFHEPAAATAQQKQKVPFGKLRAGSRLAALGMTNLFVMEKDVDRARWPPAALGTTYRFLISCSSRNLLMML